MKQAYTLALLGGSLFVILSSSVAYTLTDTILPTQKYGCPTRLGLLVHAIAFIGLFMLLQKHV